ncbi:MAG TPA: cyclase [Candidatus Dormibacteraeota bacterium]|nr:cyclase [Candidatus Dormibacteraeota bacterium]
MRERRLPVFGVLAAGAAVLVAFATALPVGASTPVNTTHSCVASALGQTVTTNQSDVVDVTAPASATNGTQFQVVLAPEPQMAPSSAGGFTIVSIKNATLRITVGNASVVGTPTLSGGSSNVGTTGVSVSGNVISVTASGPIPGGSTFTLPTLTANLQAGSAGSAATTSLIGTSSSPDLTFTTVVRSGVFTINAPTNCVPVPSPTTLSSTSVT